LWYYSDMAKIKALMIGYGNVGKAVSDRLNQINAEVIGIIRSDSLVHRSMDSNTPISTDTGAWKTLKPDIVFLTMPSTEDGIAAHGYISHFIKSGVPVVTAEKGAMANYFDELLPHVDRLLGISATVGGGTRMLQVLRERINPQVNQVHLTLNGTLNFIMDGVSRGQSFGQVVEQAQMLGYAEPGASDHLEVINGEVVGDIPKKISIIWNYTESPEDDSVDLQYVKWKELKQPAVTEPELRQLIAEATVRRYIVSWYRASAIIPENDTVCGFEHVTGEWKIVGGFQRVDRNPLFSELNKPGPNNAMVVATGDDETRRRLHLERTRRRPWADICQHDSRRS
jgi:homoserine dehydrogenase